MTYRGEDLDPEALEQLRGLQGPEDPHLVAELIDSFLAKAPEALEELTHRVAGGQAREVERAAHKLRGLCGALGLRKMEALCEVLESEAERGQLTGAAERLDALRDAFAAGYDWLTAERAKEK